MDDWKVPITVLVAVAGAALFFHYQPHKSGDVAAWVQATGAVIAIIGTYIVGERQWRAAIRSVEEAQRIRDAAGRASMLAVIRAAYSRACEIRRALDDPAPPLRMYDAYHSSIIESLLNIMKGMPVHELGNESAIEAFVIYSGQFAFLRDALEKYVKGPNGDPEFVAELTKLEEQGYKEIDHQMRETMRQVLRSNVTVHLERIEREFAKIEHACGTSREIAT